MRCIEIEHANLHTAQLYGLIETWDVLKYLICYYIKSCYNSINRNMRCIEITETNLVLKVDTD